MDWSECREKQAKLIAPDKELIKSLLEASANKYTSSQLLTLNEITKESVFILAYDALRELLEALTLSKGYKIYNHECYTAFLKTIINDEQLAKQYDSLRQLRNSVNYYGRSITLEDVKQLTKEIAQLIKQIKIMM